MDRLTIRNSDGAWDVPLRVDDDGAYIPSQEIIDRLAAYEDTGLEPEEIKRSDALLRGFIDLSRRHAWERKLLCIRAKRLRQNRLPDQRGRGEGAGGDEK